MRPLGEQRDGVMTALKVSGRRRRARPQRRGREAAKKALAKRRSAHATGAIRSALPSERLVGLYRDMKRIRMVEEAIADRYAEAEMRCPVHLSIGQEAAAVGVCTALRVTDKIYSSHRAHAHYLAKGGDLRRMLAEIYGKAAGCVGGRGGSMHLMDLEKGMVGSIPIVASSIPLAVGSALAAKRSGADSVTVAFLGDAAVEEGVFHESANLAVLHRLPAIFVCENNLYSVYTPLKQRQPARPLTSLAKAHGMTALHGDGNDVLASFRLMTAAVRRAREGEGPSFLQLDTYRWREHCGPNFDNHLGYRTQAEFLAWKRRDPIRQYLLRLTQNKALSQKAARAMETELMGEIEEAFAFAQAAPLPSPDDAGRHVYA